MIKSVLNNLIRRIKSLKPTKSLEGLPVEVSGCLPALEILGKQIVSVAKKGNQSTEELSQSFAEMASRAQQLVSQVAGGPRGDSGIESVKEVLRLLLSKFQESNRATSETGETLEQIEIELKRVEVCANEVEAISRRARLVSLNGRIEAQRAGEHGNGFAVVAEETGKLAQNVARTSKEIGDAVVKLSATLRATTKEMQVLVEHGGQAAVECEQNVDQTLEKLSNYQSQLEQDLDSAQATGDSLASSISRSIIGLQFQDAASQRMHHVSESLENIRMHFGGMVTASEESESRTQWWLDKIAEKYCVAEEHDVHHGDSINSSTDDMSNVELF